MGIEERCSETGPPRSTGTCEKMVPDTAGTLVLNGINEVQAIGRIWSGLPNRS